jgi:N-acetyl-beta-hexosaminidase
MQEVITALDGVTATTTSAAIPINGAKKVTLVFKRADHAAGKTVFSVTVSADDSNYITYNKLIDNVVNTNGQQLTRVASWDTGAANGTKFYTLSPEDTFAYLKVKATETTDGTHSAWVIIERGER